MAVCLALRRGGWGTTLHLDSTGNALTEIGWSGSGGGVSAYYKTPVWQANYTSSAGRSVPDVSYDADPATGFPVYISNYHSATGWIQAGGTSAGAPQWAAQQALINAARSTTMSSTGSHLYSAATSA